MCNRDGFQPKRKNVSSFVKLWRGDAPFVDSELLSCLKLLKIDVGNYVILELGQLCKQISVFHEIDIESKKENGYG